MIRALNYRHLFTMKITELQISVLFLWLCSVQCVPQSSSSKSPNLNIKTLPPSKVSRQSYMSHEEIMANSDALLSEWEGEHWASLDPEEDKVAISWTNTETDITMQVRRNQDDRKLISLNN